MPPWSGSNESALLACRWPSHCVLIRERREGGEKERERKGDRKGEKRRRRGSRKKRKRQRERICKYLMSLIRALISL